jgi:hypothetical protein
MLSHGPRWCRAHLTLHMRALCAHLGSRPRSSTTCHLDSLSGGKLNTHAVRTDRGSMRSYGRQPRSVLLCVPFKAPCHNGDPAAVSVMLLGQLAQGSCAWQCFHAGLNCGVVPQMNNPRDMRECDGCCICLSAELCMCTVAAWHVQWPLRSPRQVQHLSVVCRQPLFERCYVGSDVGSDDMGAGNCVLTNTAITESYACMYDGVRVSSAMGFCAWDQRSGAVRGGAGAYAWRVNRLLAGTCVTPGWEGWLCACGVLVRLLLKQPMVRSGFIGGASHMQCLNGWCVVQQNAAAACLYVHMHVLGSTAWAIIALNIRHS